MTAKMTGKTMIGFASAPTEQMRRLWLAGLGAFSLTRKHGGQWFDRFAGEGKEFAARAVRFTLETAADTQAHATGAFAPITLRIEKSWGACADAVESGVARVLHRFGVPSKREIEALTRRVAALSRALKTAKG
jgi:poly(hydroxyalkanoate) granule-associated protein